HGLTRPWQAGTVTAQTFAAVRDLAFPPGIVVSDAESVLDSYGQTGTVFPWASVTKMLSAMSVLVAIERGMVDLNDETGPAGATVRHLLAHTSGLPFNEGQPLTEPGNRRIYSNYGFEVLAEYVTAAVGRDFEEWLEETVLIPLGMSTVLLEGSPAHGATG